MPTHRTTAAQPTDRMSPCPSGEAKAVMHAPTIYLSGAASREPTARVLPLGAGLFLGSLLAGPIMAQAVGAPAATAVDTVTAQAGAEKAVVVEPVEVSSQRPRESYLTDKTRVGRVQVDPHLLPQAVTSVPGKLMEEQQVGSLREALRNVSGLTFNAAEGGRTGDNMMLRGFYTFGDLYLDGMRDTAQYNRETFFVDRIDVLRGAAAMYFGRGQAGGVINLVSKMPERFRDSSVSVSGGTLAYREATADLNHMFTPTSGVRLNLMQRKEGSWRENPVTGTQPDVDRSGIALSAGYGLNTSNEFTFSHVYLRNRDIPDYGVSFDAATRRPSASFPASTFWGFGGNFDQSDTHLTTAAWTWKPSEDVQWRTQLRRGDYERSFWARTPSATVAPGANGLLANGAGGTGPTRGSVYETLAAQSDINARFALGGLRHEVVAGVEYLWEDGDRSALINRGGTTSANPPRFTPYDLNLAQGRVSFRGKSWAAFVQDTVELMPHWKLSLGLRRDELRARYSSLTSPRLDYGEWSKRAALSWQPDENTHYYLLWSDAFSPTADLYQLTARPQPPETSEVMELGAKWLLAGGDLAVRAALYRATKHWERNTDLESTAAILTRKRRTDGFELELAGRVNEAWEVFAGVALMNAKILAPAENVNATTGAITVANPDWRGRRARNTPPFTVNLWTTYRFAPGWTVGLGVEGKGERYGYVPTGTGALPTRPPETNFHPNTAPAYERFDAMLAWDGGPWRARLNAKNLLNRLYYDAIYDNGGFTVPGQGRQFIFTVEYRFK